LVKHRAIPTHNTNNGEGTAQLQPHNTNNGEGTAQLQPHNTNNGGDQIGV
jgi:hypothetical protein